MTELDYEKIRSLANSISFLLEEAEATPDDAMQALLLVLGTVIKT